MESFIFHLPNFQYGFSRDGKKFAITNSEGIWIFNDIEEFFETLRKMLNNQSY